MRVSVTQPSNDCWIIIQRNKGFFYTSNYSETMFQKVFSNDTEQKQSAKYKLMDINASMLCISFPVLSFLCKDTEQGKSTLLCTVQSGNFQERVSLWGYHAEKSKQSFQATYPLPLICVFLKAVCFTSISKYSFICLLRSWSWTNSSMSLTKLETVISHETSLRNSNL